jgi:hypothetical protein
MPARVLLCLGFALLLSSVAICRAEDLSVITMEGEQDDCLNERTLRARVALYLAHSQSQLDVQVQVRRAQGTLEFSVLREGVILARRRFERLPNACADRRDTLALAVALAIEHATMREPASEAPLTRDASRTAGASSGVSREGGGVDLGRELSGSPATAAGSASESPSKPLDAQATSDAKARGTKREVSEPTRASSPADQPPGVSELSRLRRRLRRTALLAGARAMFEVLPAPAFAFSLGAELAVLPYAELQLSGLVSLPVHARLPPARVRAQLFGAELLACGHTPSPLLSVHGCLGLTGGAVKAAGDGYADDLRTTVTWLAGLLRVALRWSFAARAALQLSASGHLSLIRPDLRVVGNGARGLAKLGGGALGLDMIVAFR